MDDLAVSTLREMIIKIVQECADSEVLDLVFKIISTL